MTELSCELRCSAGDLPIAGFFSFPGTAHLLKPKRSVICLLRLVLLGAQHLQKTGEKPFFKGPGPFYPLQNPNFPLQVQP